MKGPGTFKFPEWKDLPPLQSEKDLPQSGIIQHRCWCACTGNPKRPCGETGYRNGMDCAWCRAMLK